MDPLQTQPSYTDIQLGVLKCIGIFWLLIETIELLNVCSFYQQNKLGLV